MQISGVSSCCILCFALITPPNETFNRNRNLLETTDKNVTATRRILQP